MGARLFELEHSGSRLGRYFALIAGTLRILRQEKPDIAFVQNPSIVLTTLVTLYGRLARLPVVVDAHNAGVYPAEGRKVWLQYWAHFLFRMASLTIVSNENLVAYIHQHGGRAFALPDPLPELRPHPQRTDSADNKGGAHVVFICTWAPDEPYLAVLRAAQLLGDHGVKIFITGRSRGREREFGEAIPANALLTGYLSEEHYISLLQRADLIVDLTTREDCLVCGAYEAAALEKPLLLSDTKALRSYFNRGALYTDNSAGDIASKIQLALRDRNQLQSAMRQFRQETLLQWSRRREELERNELSVIARQ